MSALTIHLDFPSPDLFPNRTKGRHWGALHQKKKDARELAFFLTEQQSRGWVPSGGTFEMTVVFQMPDRRKRDTDNLLAAAKSALDGMAQALEIDDFQFQPVKVYRKFGQRPGAMVVTIEDSDNGQDRPE